MTTGVEDVFVPYGTRIAFLTYTFVFGYDGFLKIQAFITGLSTPVRGEVANLVNVLGLPEYGISLTVVMLFIGLCEVSLGALFATKRLYLVTPVFLVYQFGTFLTLIIAKAHSFQEPYLVGIPWLFDTFAAYILKNTIFVGGFLLLIGIELGTRRPHRATGASDERESRSSAAD
jgi:hypothetical protein